MNHDFMPGGNLADGAVFPDAGQDSGCHAGRVQSDAAAVYGAHDVPCADTASADTASADTAGADAAPVTEAEDNISRSPCWRRKNSACNRRKRGSDNGRFSRREILAAVFAAYRRFLPACALVAAAFILWGLILFFCWLR